MFNTTHNQIIYTDFLPQNRFNFLIYLIQNIVISFKISSVLIINEKESISRDLQMPKIIIENGNYFQLFVTSIHTDILGVIFVTKYNFSNVIKNLSNTLIYYRGTKLIFVADSLDKEIITKIFEKCWSNLLINAMIFLTSNSKHYQYKSYPYFEIQENTKEIFPDKLQNLHGHPISFAVIHDPPRSFKYTFKNQEHYGGFAWRIFAEFTKKLNISKYTTYSYEYFYKDPYILLDLVQNGTVDFAPVVTFQNPGNISYFLEYSRPYLIVPVLTEVNEVWYFFGPLNVWGLFGIFLFIVYFVLLLIVTNKIMFNKYDVLKNLGIAVKCFLLQQNINPKLIKNNIKFVYCFMLLANVLLVTKYNSLLGSTLTTFEKVDQVNTFDDLKRHNIQLMVIKSEFELMKAGKIPYYFPEKYKDEVISMDYMEYVKHRDFLNSSYAYVMPSDKWTIYSRAQRLRNKKIFRLMKNQNFRSYDPISFCFGKDSMYFSAFNSFLIRMYSTGLFDEWKINAVFEMAKGRILYKFPREGDKDFKPLSLQYYLLPLYILGTGLFVSSLLCIGEVINEHNFKNRKIKKNFKIVRFK